jgi:septal ring factor EnvC (AmiA/AmiB activator)
MVTNEVNIFKMKTLLLASILFLVACGKSSSPDGRSQLRDKSLQREIDILKNQQTSILDSLSSLNAQIKELSQSQK